LQAKDKKIKKMPPT